MSSTRTALSYCHRLKIIRHAKKILLLFYIIFFIHWCHLYAYFQSTEVKSLDNIRAEISRRRCSTKSMLIQTTTPHSSFMPFKCSNPITRLSISQHWCRILTDETIQKLRTCDDMKTYCSESTNTTTTTRKSQTSYVRSHFTRIFTNHVSPFKCISRHHYTKKQK